ARALRGRGLDELALSEGKDLPAQRSPDVRDENEGDHSGRDPEARGREGDAEVMEAVDRQRSTERDPEQHDREGPDQVEDARDDPVCGSAEIAGEQR